MTVAVAVAVAAVITMMGGVTSAFGFKNVHVKIGSKIPSSALPLPAGQRPIMILG